VPCRWCPETPDARRSPTLQPGSRTWGTQLKPATLKAHRSLLACSILRSSVTRMIASITPAGWSPHGSRGLRVAKAPETAPSPPLRHDAACRKSLGTVRRGPTLQGLRRRKNRFQVHQAEPRKTYGRLGEALTPHSRCGTVPSPPIRVLPLNRVHANRKRCCCAGNMLDASRAHSPTARPGHARDCSARPR